VLSGRGLCDELITRPEAHWELSRQKQTNKQTQNCERKRNKQIKSETKTAEREQQEIIKQREIADSDL
jgi:hypothetical protein